LVFPIAQNRSLNIVAFVTKGIDEAADVEESWTSICDRSDVEVDFAGFDKYVQEIISLMPEKPSKWKLNDRLPLDQWHYLGGKVVLLGDAAHAMLPHLGAGAGQSLEDGWVLGRAISEHLASSLNAHFKSLSSTAQLYQSVRLPRAQKTQRTSRAAGDTYELQTDDMKDKTFEECLPMIAERTRERMKWVWEEDLDAAYEKIRDGKGELVEDGVGKKAEMTANGTMVGKQAGGIQTQ
jgi:salicylate hydroxylase